MSVASSHIDDRISELLLGDVSDGEREALEAHVAGCARCARELTQAADAFAQLALALPAEAPPPSLRARILEDARPPRLAAMLDKVAAVFDITRPKARAVLDQLDDSAAQWMDGPVPRSWILPANVSGGPQVAGAFIGFVKMGAGVRWPPHRHLGRESMLVLEGGFRQDDGLEAHPGQLQTMEEGTAHGFTIFADGDCIAATVVFEGVSFDDPEPRLGGVSK